jgi:hypothetical protein
MDEIIRNIGIIFLAILMMIPIIFGFYLIYIGRFIEGYMCIIIIVLILMALACVAGTGMMDDGYGRY